MHKFAVIDFETTGLSPQKGDRVIEIGIAITDGVEVLDTYQSLMNPGISIPYFITDLTGISQSMVSSARQSQTVMREASQFIGGLPLVAHNASFDRKFFISELERLNQTADTQFICTMLVGRRLYPLALNHKLATLAQLHDISTTGHHRALADAVMTAQLLDGMRVDLRELYNGKSIDAPFLRKYQRTKKADTKSSNKKLSNLRNVSSGEDRVRAPDLSRKTAPIVSSPRRASSMPPRSEDTQTSTRSQMKSASNDTTGSSEDSNTNWLLWIIGIIVILAIFSD